MKFVEIKENFKLGKKEHFSQQECILCDDAAMDLLFHDRPRLYQEAINVVSIFLAGPSHSGVFPGVPRESVSALTSGLTVRVN